MKRKTRVYYTLVNRNTEDALTNSTGWPVLITVFNSRAGAMAYLNANKPYLKATYDIRSFHITVTKPHRKPSK